MSAQSAAHAADQRSLELSRVSPGGPQRLNGGGTALPEDTQQQMLCADPAAAPSGGFPGGTLNDPPGSGCEALGRGQAGEPYAHQFPQRQADLFRCDILFLEAAPGGTLLLKDAQQQVFAADVAVSQLPGGLPGQPQGTAGSGSELIVVHIAIPSVCLLSHGVFPLTEVLHISGSGAGFCPCNFKSSCYNVGTNL